MEIDFLDRRLGRILASEAAMRRELGAGCARKLAMRMAALRAVDCAMDLLPLPGRWHILTGDWKEHMSADLDHPRRLIVRPLEPAPRASDGIDWGSVKGMTVVGIVDTH